MKTVVDKGRDPGFTREDWAPVAKRLNEAPGIVYLELDEMATHGGETFLFHSLSVYEFNDAGKISRIDVYMQQPTEGAGSTDVSDSV